jgi:hypothetical protein
MGALASGTGRVIDPNQNVLPPPDPPLQQTSAGLPLPEGAELSFWREEVDRSDRAQQPYLEGWKKNIEWYEGKKPRVNRPTT